MDRERKQGACPFLVVDEVVYALERMSDLCSALGAVNERDGTVSVDSMAHSFRVVRDLLDAQIKSLDGIDWSRKGAR